ncbi:hypothetical protein Trco_002235 [Trichoderma cornu-damae]|uniref:Uncharacterized protein n=1 Tax=Trichoderma cornu-damae TaxID=654480 RepID=A0A9P8TYY0_9HYPO|nr:hypothetical protein Trco_002235 [Trichoderma cornu-damae]
MPSQRSASHSRSAGHGVIPPDLVDDVGIGMVASVVQLDICNAIGELCRRVVWQVQLVLLAQI